MSQGCEYTIFCYKGIIKFVHTLILDLHLGPTLLPTFNLTLEHIQLWSVDGL